MATRSLVFCLIVSLLVMALGSLSILLFADQGSSGWALVLVGLLIGAGAGVQAGWAGALPTSEMAAIPARVKQS